MELYPYFNKIGVIFSYYKVRWVRKKVVVLVYRVKQFLSDKCHRETKKCELSSNHFLINGVCEHCGAKVSKMLVGYNVIPMD